ncbi:hypothetical protein [Mesorhizobium sp. 113-3-3]|uniref:hypothetical protein n=1 Tax=Mesorhizobium sp. 113-3-3 TaxID=2744516 RepID=UPI001FCF9D9E|nr:hypothetical protein [Mesorhizobium sp. 113-3-3]
MRRPKGHAQRQGADAVAGLASDAHAREQAVGELLRGDGWRGRGAVGAAPRHQRQKLVVVECVLQPNGAGGIPEQEVGLRDMAGAFDLACLGLFNGDELRVLDAEVHQRGRDAPVPLSGEFRFLLVQWRAGGDKGRKIQQLRDDSVEFGLRPTMGAGDFRR